MLSRSSSNATDRLRRAKSTSSAHTTASGHQRVPTITDPFVLRRQAEAAAVEAYIRAQQHDDASNLASRPRPNRRRSQNTGRSEGSHFADARRKSIQSEAAKPQAQSRCSSPSYPKVAADEDTVITRRRSVIPPAVSCVDSSQSPVAPPLRKRTSGYTDGSPAPRYSQLVERPSSILQSHASEAEQTDGYAGNLAHLSSFTQDGRPQSLQQPGHGPGSELGLHDFQIAQPKRVRQRKSFLGSFPKRNSGFDTALPPFNHAGSEVAAPDSGLSLDMGPSIKVAQHKTRNFSDTLKGRLKKVFRRTSKISMPAQHVHAKDFHFSVRDHDISDASFVDYTDPFMTVAAEEPRPASKHRFTTAQSAASATSTAHSSTSRSRVTSWANSTLPISSIRTNNGPFTVPGAHHEPDENPPALHEIGAMAEAPVLKRSGSTTTLRKASSFFVIPIRNKLRRTSKTDLRGSDESQGLYSALQSRIRTSRSTETANEAPNLANLEGTPWHGSKKLSALAMLPSQRHCSTSTALSSSVSSRNRYRGGSTALKSGDQVMSTIRPVTPELAPVPEAASAEVDRTVIHHEIDSPAESTPKSGLRRSHAVKAPPPSKELLLKRTEKAESRWTTALAAGGLSSYPNDNPYELPSLSQHDRAKSTHNSVFPTSRAEVISPSLYSRATDGASPRPDTPSDIGMATITITGREVRKYDISPPKHAHRQQTSRDWRKWLSDEMNSFVDDEQPPRPTSGASMNGRYPYVNRSRNSSQQSFSCKPEGAEYRTMHSMARSRKASIETAMHSHGSGTASRHRVLSKPKSIAEIEAASHVETVPRSDPLPVAAGPAVKSAKAFNRPKSAYELRVNYKNNAADRFKPLEVRRKMVEPNILEDNTILNIYAGPYAAGGNYENQRPAELEGSGIPSLSSSEWLGSKKKSARTASSRISPAKSPPRRSPGQRMVTSWLDEKSKENGAFV